MNFPQGAAADPAKGLIMRNSLLVTTAALGIAMMPLGAAQAQTPFDWSGFYAGLHGGFLSGDVNLTGILDGMLGGPISGLIGGPLAGYNFAPTTFFSGPVVFGVEGDFGLTGATGTGTSQGTDVSIDLYYDLSWDAHLRARAGVPMGNFMPFVAGGLAFADLNITETGGTETGGAPQGGLYTGWTVGTGADVALGNNMVGRAEVLYDDYGTKAYTDYSASLTAWTGRVALIWRLP
jgi:outer membrane immunogenic protein